MALREGYPFAGKYIFFYGRRVDATCAGGLAGAGDPDEDGFPDAVGIVQGSRCSGYAKLSQANWCDQNFGGFVRQCGLISRDLQRFSRV